jgi:hypothetical protein
MNCNKLQRENSSLIKRAFLKITVRHSDESQNLIRTMTLWEIAGQARNDDTLIFRGNQKKFLQKE